MDRHGLLQKLTTITATVVTATLSFGYSATLLGAMLWLLATDPAAAHHILGRPAYSLNEDSNTPPSIQGEEQIGDYIVTYMVFPAFPKPDKPGRIHLYVKPLDGGGPFNGKVTFKAHKEFWLPSLGAGKSVELGVQPPDGGVFRQSFRFHKAGEYVVNAEFEAGGEPYLIEFPMRIGQPPLLGPMEIILGLLFAAIVTVAIARRRQSLTAKIRNLRETDSLRP